MSQKKDTTITSYENLYRMKLYSNLPIVKGEVAKTIDFPGFEDINRPTTEWEVAMYDVIEDIVSSACELLKVDAPPCWSIWPAKDMQSAAEYVMAKDEDFYKIVVLENYITNPWSSAPIKFVTYDIAGIIYWIAWTKKHGEPKYKWEYPYDKERKWICENFHV